MRFSDPEFTDPVVHCFARCHWCKRLIPITRGEKGLNVEERQCPNCGAEISQSKVIGSLVVNLIHTSAITSANKFISFDLAVVPFLICSIILVLMKFPLWFRIPFLLIYHMPLILAVKWIHRYWYRVRFDDDEYLEAVSRMKRFLAIWIGANGINWLLLIAEITWFRST